MLTDLELALAALRSVRQELFDYARDTDDVGTIVLRDGCYVMPQAATMEDILLDRIKSILNNEKLISAMRRIEQRTQFTVLASS